MRNVEYRYSKGNSYCRSCSVDIVRNEDRCIVIDNPRQNCILCDECVTEMINLVRVDRLNRAEYTLIKQEGE